MRNSNFSKPKSLVDQLKGELTEAIIKGRLLPGQQIKELELQDWFGVSRSPIREALRLLQAEGLVEIDSYKKRFVRKITKKDLAEIFPVMACLEGLAARFAAPIISMEKVQELIKLNEKMQSAYEQGAYDRCSEFNFKFHSEFIKTTSNTALFRAMKCLTKGSIWLWLTDLYYTKTDMILNSIHEHNKIIKAFQKKDARSAEKNVQEHINFVYKRSLQYSIFDSDGDYTINPRIAR